ncbi:MAG: methionine adenosyltransferase [Oscillospiraceae bacterium]
MEDFKRMYTAESVTEGHPDKLCDLIADSILDAHLEKDPLARVACEVLATRGHILIAGEITCAYTVDISRVVNNVLHEVGYDPKDFLLELNLHRQSEDISAGVNTALEQRRGITATAQLGAGDQGVMVGYACDETPQFLPLPVVLANRIVVALATARKSGLIQGICPDGKAQVTVEYEDGVPKRLDTVIVSTQHRADKQADRLAWEIADKVLPLALRGLSPDADTRILINPSGRFVEGGPAADTGLTGRKLMVDTYGSFAPHGGGAFSGKDATKVDRSGAYMARYIAKNLVAAKLAKRCQVTLAYAIGVAEPVMVEVDTFGTGTACADDCIAAAVRKVFGLTPDCIIETLGLRKPVFAKTAVGGHFGCSEFSWEKTDKVQALREAVL